MIRTNDFVPSGAPLQFRFGEALSPSADAHRPVFRHFAISDFTSLFVSLFGSTNSIAIFEGAGSIIGFGVVLAGIARLADIRIRVSDAKDYTV